MRLRKAVILAAGLGTRLIPFTKELPKEMLPLPVPEEGALLPKPVVQIVFEQLFDAGIREYCFVVGRGKRAIEDHFTPDWDFVEYLEGLGKEVQARALRRFYEKVESSFIAWVNQPTPRGTGHAVYMARGFVEGEFFAAAAGDNAFLGGNVAAQVVRVHGERGEPLITVRRVSEPQRYGVVVGEPLGGGLYRVRRIVEKPREPLSNLANTSLYVFPPEILQAIERTAPSPRGEIEVTDAIQHLLDSGTEFLAYEAEADWVDVGNWESYLQALSIATQKAREQPPRK